MGSVFAKLSILWLYHRIFQNKQFHRWSLAMMVLVLCYFITMVAVYFTNCIPLEQLWNPQPGGHCRDMQYSDYVTVGCNILLDIAIFLLPIPPLWRLRMPTRKKVILCIIFSCGLL